MLEINKIHLGDSYELIKQIDDKSIDLIIIDPPYLIESTDGGKGNKLGQSITGVNEELKNGVFTEGLDKSILDEFMRIMNKPNIYVWCNHKQIPFYLEYFVKDNNCVFDILIWNKTNAIPLFNNKYMTDKEYCLYFRKGGYCNPKDYDHGKTVYYQPINVNDKKHFEHPTIKPINIIKNIIENSSFENEVVLDCFSGSGTTCVAAKELNRQFI